ncbi:MAG: cell wall hydrolase [Alphaproteobacteria bacterium]|nr:cell wall hydrolase [Alphaproteobacteria bacterium]
MNLLDIPLDMEAEEAAIDILARTLWGEARSASVRVKEAIAAVVLNRVRLAKERFGKDWWGTTVVEACLASGQFPCWRLSPSFRTQLMQVPDTDPDFAICRRIAARAVRGALVDPTFGATHYRRLKEQPLWAERRRPKARIGSYRFYQILS